MVLQNAGYKACVIFLSEGKPYILFDFEEIYILNETLVGADNVNMYETPLCLDNVTIKNVDLKATKFLPKK
jgi:hypothetical protein